MTETASVGEWTSCRGILALLLFLTVTSCQTRGPLSDLRPFASDGCTCFPEGTKQDPSAWRAACETHDRAYWQGGTMKQRREADHALRGGIAASGYPVISNLTYVGVRLGGSAILPTPWRWGFGWKEYPRWPRPLGEAELELVR